MDSIFQDGVCDGIGDAIAGLQGDFEDVGDMVVDGIMGDTHEDFADDVLHTEPALDGDFDGVSNDCGPSPVLAEAAEQYKGEDMNGLGADFN